MYVGEVRTSRRYLTLTDPSDSFEVVDAAPLPLPCLNILKSQRPKKTL